MCEKEDKGLVPYSDLSRRSFAALIAASAGMAVAGCATGQTAAPLMPRRVLDRDVMVTTPDGQVEAVVFHPENGRWPGVLFWPDIGGLRQSMRDMGRRLAGSGYTVLVVNPFYRSGTAAEILKLGWDIPKRMKLRELMTPAAIDGDANAFVSYLDGLAETSDAKMGVQGYCMGGPLSFRTAAAGADRMGAVGSFHGGGLVTDTPDSPHLLIGKTNARYLVAVARNDDAKEPQTKEVLRQTFAAAGRPAVVEVYDGDHGWCVPDSAVYNQPEAERAWSALLELYQTALV